MGSLRGFLGVVLLSTFLSPAADANSCKTLFSQRQSAAVRKIVSTSGWKQWLLWEQQSNLEKYRKSPDAFTIPVAKIDKSLVTVEKAPNLPTELSEKLLNGNSHSLLWVKHPHNTYDRVPFFNAEVLPEGLKGYYTASRSIAIDGLEGAYTVKAPTDYPHGPKGEYQWTKTNTKDDIDSARLRSSYIDNVDRKIGSDPKLILAKEILTVADNKTGHGYLIRDISFMKDGHYYLPAFSLPWAGRQIAQLHKVPAEEFWGEHYAELLGRSKAKLLLRYGMQMETPNPQNMLIQLDRNLKPTGVMVFRDVSDSYLVRQVAESLGEEKAIRKDYEVDYKPHRSLIPFWENSAWRLDEAGDASYSKRTLNEWGFRHDDAYKQEIEEALGVNIIVKSGEVIRDVQEFLFSDIGRAKIKQYRRRQLEQRRENDKDISKAAGF